MIAEPTPLRDRVTNWLAILAILLAGVVWPPVFGATADNARAGTLYLCSMPCGAPTEALRQTTQIHAQVTGNVARVQVIQKFENPSDDWVEGFYVFPLSAGAAVDELEMLVGERRIRGDIKRKQDARAAYEQAKSEGRRASLVDQERPNMFTTSVANIAPHSSITVQIAYLDTIPFRDGRYSLNLPLSITPRYTPGSVRDDGGPIAAPTPTPERVDAAVQNAQIEIDLEPGFPLQQVNSLNHAVLMETTGLGRRIDLRSPTVPADRDFELVWTPSVAPDTYASAFAETFGSDTYVLVSLMPPQMAAERTYKREVVFIIDTSGSMSGSSIEQARAALRLGVSRLQPGDTFNVIRFSNDATSLFPTSQPAVGVNLQSAVSFIDRLVADGGTEMRSALELAFSMPPTMDALRQIVFVTDGSVSNEAELVKLIAARIGAARLFTVGIGGAPNAYFMREAAAAGRGSFTFIPQIEQVNERMSDVFRKLENPALVDLQLHWPAGAVATLASKLPSDVYAGDPLTVVAKLSSLPQGLITLNGRSGGGTWTRQLPLRIVNDRSGVAKLWARERIAELARQKSLGGDATEAENQIVSLALEHHLVSDYTSLVAVDDTPVRPVGTDARQEQVPVSAPRGTPWASTTGFAKTATPAPLLLLIGLAALGTAFVIFIPVRTRGACVNTRVASAVALGAIGLACVTAACWIHVKAFAAQVLIDAAWDRAQQGVAQARPWPWADAAPVARMTFHDRKTLVVLEGSSGRNLAFAPSHDAASVLPGEQGNSVISAHRDTHFRELAHARVGDRIRVERPDGRRFVFSVTDVRVADSRTTRIALDGDEARLTLVTCYPFDAISPGGHCALSLPRNRSRVPGIRRRDEWLARRRFPDLCL